MRKVWVVLLAVLAVGAIASAPASAARTKSCEGIGSIVTKLRSKGMPCDDARTLSAKWLETLASGGKAVERIDGFRCERSNPPGPGRAVRCAKRKGALVVSWRYQLRS